MGLQRLSSSPSPVSLDAIKAHCRVDGLLNDDTLTTFIESAADYIERATNQTVRPTSFRLTLDKFPTGREIKLPKPPATAVGSVKYIDPTGDEQTLNPSTYTADLNSSPGRIVIKGGQTWPQTADIAAAVTITFDAGYEDSALPFTLRQGILLLAAFWFETREGATDRRIDEVPLAVSSIIEMHAYPEAA